MSSLACAQEEEASMAFGEQLTVSVINSFLRFSEMGTHFFAIILFDSLVKPMDSASELFCLFF